MKPIKSLEVQTFCYSDSELSETVTVDLHSDGDVVLSNDEADIILTLDDLFDVVKDFVDVLLLHKIEEQADIIKQMEALDNG
jgi:hypothetical protein